MPKPEFITQLAESKSDIRACFDTLRERCESVDDREFVRVVEEQQGQGYRLAYSRKGENTSAVAGFRIIRTLSGGKTMYVEDLVAHEQHGSDPAIGELLSWLRRYAATERCSTIALDSALHGETIHRFLLRQGLSVTNFRFEASLPKSRGSLPIGRH